MGVLDRISKIWSQDMAIDLGTANNGSLEGKGSCSKRALSSCCR